MPISMILTAFWIYYADFTNVGDGFSAAVAAGAVMLREARHAVHSAFVLVELGAIYGLAARVAREVFRVPLLV